MLLSITLLCVLFSYGQDYNGVSSREYEARILPANPEVSGLGTFGFQPIDKYTGTANISVPLYTIDFESMNIPLRLSYNTGGIKVAQEATWVGLGWNLSSGAIITREINGFDDTKSSAQNSQPIGYIFTKEFLTREHPNYVLDINNQHKLELVSGNQNGINLDTEPDIFTVHLFGRKIRFALPKLAPGERHLQATVLDNVLVKINFDSQSRFFTIIDEFGYTYQFNTLEYSTVSRSGVNGFSSSYGELELIQDIGKYPSIHDIEQDVTSWKVNKIISPNNRELNFAYERAIHMSIPQVSDDVSVQCNLLYSDNGDPDPVVRSANGTYNHIARINTFENAYLSRIYGDFGSVDFQLSQDRLDLFTKDAFNEIRNPTLLYTYPFIPFSENLPKKLSGITVKNKNNKTIQTIDFGYSYFNQDDLNNTQLSQYEKKKHIRLKLDEVTVNDKAYQFEYISPNNLAPKDSKSVDFWGFYNGVQNTQRIPSFGRFHAALGVTETFGFELFMDYEGANRKSDINFGKIGLLETVIHPTKGKTVYQYEAHKATLEKPGLYTPKYSSNGTFKSSQIGNSKDYKFNYQYLKKANDPDYSFASNTPCGTTHESLTNGETFEITNTNFCNRDYNFEAKTTLSCSVGCGQGITPSGAATWLRNVDTGQVYDLFSFGAGYNANNNYTVNLETRLMLPLGTYKFEYNSGWSVNSPFLVVANNSSSAIAWNKAELGNPEQYEEFEVGGARVQSVIEKDIDNTVLQTKAYNYTYTNPDGNTSSSGVLMDELIFHSKNNGFFEYTPESYYGNTFNMHSSNVIRGNNSASGSHIGYSRVAEILKDQQGQNNGQVIHTYVNEKNEYVTRNIGEANTGYSGANFPKIYYGEVYLLNMMPKTAAHKNGKVLKEIIKDNTDNNKRITTNSYVDFKGANGYFNDEAYPHIAHQLYLPQAGSCPTTLCGFYPEITYYKKVKMSDVTGNYFTKVKTNQVTFFDGQEITNTTEYFYENNKHYLPTKVNRLTSDGLVSTKTYYPDDILDPNHPLLLENRLATPIRVESFKDDNKMSTQVTDYENRSETSFTTQATSLQIAKKNDPLEERVKFELYDDRGNLLQAKQIDGKVTSYIWSYHKMYPVAKIENATFTQVANALGVTETALKNFAENAIPTLDNLRSALPAAMVTTYTYDPLVGVTTITDPKGQTAYYRYDDSNRLEYVLDQDEYVAQQVRYNYEGQGAAAFGNLDIIPSVSGDILPNQAVTFTSGTAGSNMLYTWSINGVQEQCSTTPGFSKTFTTEGNYTVSLVASNTQTGQSVSKTINATVAYPELSTPTISKTHTYVTHGTNVTFTASGISNGSGNYRYEWYVDNVKQSATGTTFQYSSTTTATYNIYFKLIDAITNKETRSTSHDLYVYPVLSQPSIDINTSNIVFTGTTVTFTAKNIGGGSGNLTYKWSMDDDPQNETGTTLVRTFDATGTYNMKFEVIDNTIPSYVRERSITINVYNPLSEPSLSVGDDTGSDVLDGTTVTITASGIGGGSGNRSYQWKVNGQVQSYTGTKLVKKINGAQRNIITFTVNDNTIPNHSKEKSIEVFSYNPLAQPSLSKSVTKPDILKGTSVTFTAGNLGGGSGDYSYEWSINGSKPGGGGTSLTYKFDYKNTYTIRFKIKDNKIESHFKEVSLIIYAHDPLNVPSLTSNLGAHILKNFNTTFTGGSIGGGSGSRRYEWRIGSTTQSYTGTQYVRSFGSKGKYTVIFKVIDTKIPNHSKERAYEINAWDKFSGATVVGKEHIVRGTTLNFRADANGGSGINYRTYEWYLNGVKQSETSRNFSYRHITTGSYKVKFKVFDTRIQPTHYEESAEKTVYSYSPMQVTATPGSGYIENSTPSMTFRANTPTGGSGQYTYSNWKIWKMTNPSWRQTTNSNGSTYTFSPNENGEYELSVEYEDTLTGEHAILTIPVIVNKTSGGGDGDGPIGEQH